ncbi:hypothetical protein N7537_010671 [Penicillium hordei]|uniref:Uncharacterized protein n=1 Tax=Penicillium hordei TaxID=40994 RepID=A0AAD6DVC2_9EURO|nr:uncharacterized protein N7537_010671 [Penicillium hordei]KAJ5593767.1 hypothetical protein N7537_010671 [Penicillium hordei]
MVQKGAKNNKSVHSELWFNPHISERSTAFEFISRKENDTFWDEILPKAPQAYRMRGELVMMERILPLPKVVGKALISQFCALDKTEIETSSITLKTSTV